MSACPYAAGLSARLRKKSEEESDSHQGSRPPLHLSFISPRPRPRSLPTTHSFNPKTCPRTFATSRTVTPVNERIEKRHTHSLRPTRARSSTMLVAGGGLLSRRAVASSRGRAVATRARARLHVSATAKRQDVLHRRCVIVGVFFVARRGAAAAPPLTARLWPSRRSRPTPAPLLTSRHPRPRALPLRRRRRRRPAPARLWPCSSLVRSSLTCPPALPTPPQPERQRRGLRAGRGLH